VSMSRKKIIIAVAVAAWLFWLVFFVQSAKAWSPGRTDYLSVYPTGAKEGDFYDVAIKCGTTGFPALFEVSGAFEGSPETNVSDSVYMRFHPRVRVGYGNYISIRWASSSNSAYCYLDNVYKLGENYVSYKKVESDFNTEVVLMGLAGLFVAFLLWQGINDAYLN